MIHSVTRKYTQHVLAMAALLGFFTLSAGGVAQARSAETERLTKKEVKALMTNAKTPEDHLRLAQYFSAKADRLEAESRQHQQLADVYRNTPISTLMAMKNPMGPRTAAHCEHFAQSLAKAAKSARQSAAAHEQMAKDIAQSAQ